jgi:hypothetical protein
LSCQEQRGIAMGKYSKILGAIALVFISSPSIGAEVSYRTGIALSKSLESTYRHRYEVEEAGQLFLKAEELFSSSVSKTEWAVLKRHFINYLRIHDDPKTWERDRLTEFGYPENLPTIKAFLAKSYGTSFQDLPENDIAHEVKSELNLTEMRFKTQWASSQKLSNEIFKTLMFWEHYIDILATRLSVERATELNFKYELYSATEWLLRIYKSEYKDHIIDRVDALKEFEKQYFDFVVKTRCAHHLVSAN